MDFKNIKSKFRSRLVAFAAGLSVFLPALAQQPASDITEKELSEAVGTVLSEAMARAVGNLKTLGVEVNPMIVASMISDRLMGKELPYTPQEADMLIDEYIRSRRVAVADTLALASQREFIDSVASLDGATLMPDGLVVVIITEGEGPLVTKEDSVVVKYIGRLSDGEIFDRTQPEEEVTFPVNELVKGFTEGLTFTRPGGTYRIVIPPELAYGEKGIPGAIPGNAALDFTVEILAVRRGTPQKNAQ